MEDVIATLRARVAELEQQQKIGCINCGEAHDGGYLSGHDGDVNEGAVGPFCSQCWRFLEQTFAIPRRDPPEQP